MSTDPFDELRLPTEPVPPDPGFVARLRARLEDRLRGATDLPTIDRPQQRTTMTDTPAPTSAPATTLVPYICAAPAAEAIVWYGDVFGAVETVRYTGDDGRIGHAELAFGGARLMLSDEYPDYDAISPRTLGGTPLALHLGVPDVDAAYARAVAAGARGDRPPQDQPYGERSATITDPFGHRWMLQTPIGSPSLDDIRDQAEGWTITGADEPDRT